MFKTLKKLERANRKFFKKIWQYIKWHCQKFIHDLKAHDPDYVLSNYGKLPAYLHTRVESTKSISLDELERL